VAVQSTRASCRGRGGRRRGLGRGRGRRGDSTGEETVEEAAAQPLFGKDNLDNFTWHADAPNTGRRREQDIIHQVLGVTALARTNAKHLLGAFQFFITEEMTNNIVLQINREARRRIRAWNESNPEKLDVDWKPVDGEEVRAFIGLCILAGAFRSSHEPVSTLWSGREGRPVFTATMSRSRFTDMIKYIRFDAKGSRAERQHSEKLAAFRDMWTMFTEQLPKYYIPGNDLCVDKQLVAFRGRCGFRQYILSKPSKYGLKILWCCDANTSYPLTADVYLGTQPGEQRETGEGARVVQQLTSLRQSINQSIKTHFYSAICRERIRGRNVAADNFFTSVPLVQDLLVDGRF